MKEGFNPSSGETPLRLTTKVEHEADESNRDFCNYCAVLDPRLPHKARRVWISVRFVGRCSNVAMLNDTVVAFSFAFCKQVMLSNLKTEKKFRLKFESCNLRDFFRFFRHLNKGIPAGGLDRLAGVFIFALKSKNFSSHSVLTTY